MSPDRVPSPYTSAYASPDRKRPLETWIKQETTYETNVYLALNLEYAGQNFDSGERIEIV